MKPSYVLKNCIMLKLKCYNKGLEPENRDARFRSGCLGRPRMVETWIESWRTHWNFLDEERRIFTCGWNWICKDSKAIKMQAVNYGRDEGSMWERRSRWEGRDFVAILKSLTPKARGRPMGILGREEKDHFSSIGCD